MKVVLLIGSGLRKGVIPHMVTSGFGPAVVGVPAGPRFAALPELLRDEAGPPVRVVRRSEMHEFLAGERPDVVQCVGWPFLFGPEIVDGPWLLLNSHPTLLPKYRGPNPWFNILANGEREAGVTIHQIDAGMDTGPMLHQARIPLTPFDTYRSMKAQLVALEPIAIVSALSQVKAGDYSLTPQDESKASTFVEKRTPEDSVVDAERPLAELVDSIRACDPEGFPAFFWHHGQKICIRLWRPERQASDHPDSL